jgi:hypothetical protein
VSETSEFTRIGTEASEEVLALLAVDDPLGDLLEGLGAVDALEQRRGGLGGRGPEAPLDLARQHRTLGGQALLEPLVPALLEPFLPPAATGSGHEKRSL